MVSENYGGLNIMTVYYTQEQAQRAIDLIKEIEGGLNKTTIKWSMARKKLLEDIEKNDITDGDIRFQYVVNTAEMLDNIVNNKMTNRDVWFGRVIKLTDEEIVNRLDCPSCPTHGCLNGIGSCEEDLQKWFKAEAKFDEEGNHIYR